MWCDAKTCATVSDGGHVGDFPSLHVLCMSICTDIPKVMNKVGNVKPEKKKHKGR